jgi:hypothetical protein
MMQPTHSLPLSAFHAHRMEEAADEPLAKVKAEDLQWANDSGRRVMLCWFLKGWFPVDFSPESAYDTLSSQGGKGKDGLLQNIVHECLRHPMTAVSYKPTDCALVLNRPCLRFKNINFKLAGFVRVDGSRYLKADAVQRYQDQVTHMPLVDVLMDAASLGPDWRPFGPKLQRKGSWAFMDVAAMRVRAHLPPASAPSNATASRTPHPPRAPQDALRDMAESFDIMLSHDVHGHLKMVGKEVRRTPPSGAAARIASHRPPVLRRPCTAASSRRTCGRSPPTRAAGRSSTSTRTRNRLRHRRLPTSPSSPTSSSSRLCGGEGRREGVEGWG